MLIYITAPPQQKTHKNHLPPPSPHVTSSPLAPSLPQIAPALFVSPSIRLFVWLVVTSSLCPLSLCPILSRCHTTSMHCISSLVVPLVLVDVDALVAHRPLQWPPNLPPQTPSCRRHLPKPTLRRHDYLIVA